MLRAIGYYRTTWTGSARHNLKRQLPEVARGFPEVAHYYPATINVRFEPKIIIAGFDHRTAPVCWAGGVAGEVFDLVRVRLVIQPLTVTLRALMYVAHWSPHRDDPHKHEFLAERFVEGLAEDMPIELQCDRQAIELPYTSSVRGGNGRPRLARTLVLL